jgi:hypothetical protein
VTEAAVAEVFITLWHVIAYKNATTGWLVDGHAVFVSGAPNRFWGKRIPKIESKITVAA